MKVEYGGNYGSQSNIHLYQASVDIKNSTITDSDGYGIYCNSASPSITGCTITGNQASGVYVTGISTPYIRYTNMYNNSPYNMYNAQSSDITAPNNWWGTTDTDAINNSIYDHHDTPSYGIVYYNPYLNAPAGATDTTPPTLTITSPAPNITTHTPTITVAGTASDASGIASVTVNGEPANGTLDCTLDWSANVTLTEGENTITVVATDGGEGLTTTAAVTVHYEPVRGDLNSDGTLTPADAAIALRLAASGGWDANADVNHDDHITSLDALMILQAAAGRIEL